MQSTRKLQIFLIIVVCGLIAFIFNFGRNNPTALFPEQEEASSEDLSGELEGVSDVSAKNAEFKTFVLKEISDLGPEVTGQIEALKEQLQYSPVDSAEIFKEIAELLKEAYSTVGAGYYFEQTALTESNEKYWLSAGDMYYRAQRAARDTQLYNALVRKTIYTYENALEYDPGNLEARANLAVTYFESGKDPMKGVGILRENYEVNPEHENTLRYLGMINMRSGNYDRAKERFEKLITLYPDKPFYYYYLGEIYFNEEQYEKALEAFKEYRRLVQDPALNRQASDLIRKTKEKL